jgi:hypothetical protein
MIFLARASPGLPWVYDGWMARFAMKNSQRKYLRLNLIFTHIFRGLRFGERGGARTRDHLIKSQVLYQLSYALVAGGLSGACDRFKGRRS